MKSTILFADRDPSLAEAVRRTLMPRGHDVITCTNGRDCIKYLKEFAPTILVLDHQILFGNANGVWEWLLHADSYLPPMVVVASDQNGIELPDRLDAWIDVHISRPKSIEDLLPFVHQLESVAWWSQSAERDTSQAMAPVLTR